MNCTDVREVLSAYVDGELSPGTQVQVYEHLEHCSACSGQLNGFENLSALVASSGTAEPPAEIWHRLERQLNERPTSNTVGQRLPWHRPVSRLIAIAASVLLIVGGSWFIYDRLSDHSGHVTSAMGLGNYLDQFQRSPATAQEMFLAHYKSTPVAAEDVVQYVGYRPAVAGGLPLGYTIETTHVVEMPCCTCVQTLCRRNDNSPLVIFEHTEEGLPHFGNRTEIMTECAGKQCCMVQLNDQIAATWKRGERQLAVVGIRDVQELGTLMAWMDR